MHIHYVKEGLEPEVVAVPAGVDVEIGGMGGALPGLLWARSVVVCLCLRLFALRPC